MAYKKKIAGITIELDADTSALVKKLDGVSKQIGNISKSFDRVGTDLTRNVTVPIATGFGAAIKTAADFDSQMSKVKAISGATEDEFALLENKAREMGEKTKFSATESGEAFEYMAMAGWKTDEMLNGINGIMSLAAASGEDLGTTSDIVTDALTAFGLGADQAGRFSDILAAAATNANTDVGMMGESFKYVAPVAGALGYSVEDVATALGIMANSGIKADMAGTSLRNMFQRMAKPTKESQEAMDRLGISMYDDEGKMYSFREIMEQMRGSFSEINMPLEEYNAQLDELDAQLEDGSITQKQYDKSLEELNKQAFGAEGAEKARAAAMLGGTRAMAGLLAISNASDEEFNQLTDAIDSSSDSMAKLADGSIVPLNDALESGQDVVDEYNGQAEAMAAVMQDNLSGDITVLLSQLQELAISLGKIMMPLIRDIVGMLQGVVDWLNSLDDSQKETILKVAAVAAAIGPVLLVIGKVIGVVSSVISIITTVTTVLSAVGAAITAVSWPVLAVIAAIAALIAIGVLLYKNWDTIKEKAAEVGEWISEKWNALKEKTAEAWGNIKDSIANSIGGKAIKAVWEAGKETMSEALNSMKQKYEEYGGGLKGAMAAAVEGVKQYFTAGFNFLDNLTGGKLTELKDKFAENFSNIKDNIEEKWNSIKNITSKIWGNMKESIEEHGGGIKGYLGTVMDGYKKIIQEGFKKINELTDGKLGDFINKIANTLKKAKDTFVNTFETIKEKIKNAFDFIRNLFSGELEFPHFRLPHFNISGGELPWGIGGKGTPPVIQVDWYAKAMDNAYMLNGASIFGAANGKLLGGGERGSEMIIGTNKLLEMISQAKGGDTIFNNQFTINGTNMDPEELAHEMSYYMNLEMQRMQYAQGIV